MNQLDVLCVGIACIDTIVKGFNIDRFIEKTEETHRVEKIISSIGGDAANQAINLKKLSNKVQIICGVGNDINGKLIKDSLEKQGIPLDLVLTYNNFYSSQSIVLVDKNGQRRFISPITNQELPYYIELNNIVPAKVVSIGSIGSLPFRNITNISNTINAAKAQNSIVCADVICSGWFNDIKQIEKVLNKIDYIFPNKEEATILTGKNNLSEMATTFLNLGVKNVIIKLGNKGCFFKNQENEFVIPGVQNINVIDTTGAGDSFVAGFITGLVNNDSDIECCRYGNAIAAINVQNIGATTNNYIKDKIYQYINFIRNEEKNEKHQCK